MSHLPRGLALAPLIVLLFLMQDPVRLALLDAAKIWTVGDASSYSCAADVLLVMGAAQYDGRPSPAFQRRLDLAAELYHEGCARRIVVSGGSREGDRFSEGEAGVAYLAASGVPAEALVAETEARTSFENIRNSLPLLGRGPVLVVTDDMHAYRSRWLVRRFGLEAESATVATGEGRLAYGARELVSLLAYQTGYLR